MKKQNTPVDYWKFNYECKRTGLSGTIKAYGYDYANKTEATKAVREQCKTYDYIFKGHEVTIHQHAH